MITAYDYPLLGFFWSMLWFFLLFAWLMALFYVLADVFRSDDMGGFSKAIWILFILFLPFLGVFVYLIARATTWPSTTRRGPQAQQAAFQSYVQETTATSGPADQLAQLVTLRDSGAITEAEYESGKAQDPLLSSPFGPGDDDGPPVRRFVRLGPVRELVAPDRRPRRHPVRGQPANCRAHARLRLRRADQCCGLRPRRRGR